MNFSAAKFKDKQNVLGINWYSDLQTIQNGCNIAFNKL